MNVAGFTVYASTACVSASIPVDATRDGGRVLSRSGSTRATAGNMCGPLMLILNFLPVCVITETHVTSLAVPHVVGMARTGNGGDLYFSLPS